MRVIGGLFRQQYQADTRNTFRDFIQSKRHRLFYEMKNLIAHFVILDKQITKQRDHEDYPSPTLNCFRFYRITE
jgi:hypothetical protein